MTQPKTGLEKEGMIIDLNGDVADVANLLLNNDPLNIFTYEGLESQVEQVTSPYTDSLALAKGLVLGQDLFNRIMSQEYLLAPICYMGNGPQTINYANPKIASRLKVYHKVCGKEKSDELTVPSGTHINVDICPWRPKDQFNVLTSLIPTAVLTSASPVSHEGLNSLFDYRSHSLFDYEEGVFSNVPEEEGMIESFEELVDGRDHRRFENWKRKAFEKGGKEEDFEGWAPENCGYPFIRYRTTAGGIFEIRFNGSVPNHVLASAMTIPIGFNRAIFDPQVKIEYAQEDGDYSFEQGHILVPTFSYAKSLHKMMITEALGNQEVLEFNEAAAQFSKRYLTDEELVLLGPVEEMLRERKNFAQEMTEQLPQKTNSQYSLDDRRNLALYVAQRNNQGTEWLRERL